MRIANSKGTYQQFLNEVEGLKKVPSMDTWINDDGTKIITIKNITDENFETYYWLKHLIKDDTCISGSGYKMVTINRKQYSIHRLVALAWVPKIEGKNYVNHKDGNRINNKSSNLEWVTQKENVDKAYENGQISLTHAYKGRYTRSTGRYTTPDGKKIYMTEKEYCDMLKKQGKRLRGWQKQYK